MHAEARVDSYTMPLDAELAKAFLESHDIPVRLEGDVLVGSAHAIGPALGGIGLIVEEQDEARARALLDGYHHALRRRRVRHEDIDDDNDDGIDEGVATDDFDDTDNPSEDSPDDMAARAWGSTLLAFVLLPVVMHLYSVALLLRVEYGLLSSEGRKRYWTAWVLNLLVLTVAGWLIIRALG